jgi:hypothetical protein
LEIVKLAVAALTPILVLFFGVMVARAARRVEAAEWASRKVVERRLELYDKLAPLLNDLYCFFTAVGHFREITPAEALDSKRRADKFFFVNRYLMERAFAEAYQEFMNGCFKHYVDIGRDALLRASVEHQRAERGPANWEEGWAAAYVSDRADVTPRHEIKMLYHELMEEFARELGVERRSVD